MKDKIVEASIELFNSMGTHRVTTNHIIDKLGISPGTFYYHFKNKEEILRRIFGHITSEFDRLYAFENNEPDLKLLTSAIKNIYRLYYKYRFFYYDISMLLDRDEELAERYRENCRQKTAGIITIIQTLENNGVFKKFVSDKDRQLFIENLRVLSDYRLSFHKTAGDIKDSEIIEHGIMSLMAYLQPYLGDDIAFKLKADS